MALVYSIRDWNKHFEVSQSRKVEGPLDWVAIPTKHDGKSYRRIMLLDDGPSIYAAWILIVQIAAKCDPRGILADKDGPLDASDLAIKTGCRPQLFEKAFKVLTGNKIGWLLVAEWEGSGSTLPLQDRTGQDNTGQDSCSEPAEPASPPLLIFPCVGSGPKLWELTQGKVAEYRDSFPGIDVMAECRAARQWCQDNPQKRKTFGGMPGFLTRWLTKAQNGHGATVARAGTMPKSADEIYGSLEGAK